MSIYTEILLDIFIGAPTFALIAITISIIIATWKM